MLKPSLFIAAIFFSSFSFAQETSSFTIKQIIESDRVVIAEANSDDVFDTNKTFLATFENGSQCSLRVIEESKRIIPLDLSTCSRATELRVGQKLEPSLYTLKRKASSEKPPRPEASEEKAETPSEKGDVMRNIEALSYTPNAGMTGVQVSYKLSNEEFDLRAGTSTAKQKNRTSLASARIFYGVTDSLALGLDMDLILNRDVGFESTGANYISRGISDPTITANWRLMDQSDRSQPSLYIYLGYSPLLVEAKSASSEDIGTAGKGCNATIAGLGLFKELKTVELGLLFKHSFCDAGSSEDATSGDKTEMEAQEQSEIEVQAKFGINQQFSIISSLGYSSTPSTSEKDVNSGVATRMSSYDTTSFSLGARFSLVPKKSTLDFVIQGDSRSDITISDGTDSVKVIQDSGSSIIMNLKTQF